MGELPARASVRLFGQNRTCGRPFAMRKEVARRMGLPSHAASRPVKPALRGGIISRCFDKFHNFCLEKSETNVDSVRSERHEARE